MVVLSCRGAALQFVIYIQEMAAATSDAMLMKHWECELVHAQAMLSQLQRKRNGGYGQFWECPWPLLAATHVLGMPLILDAAMMGADTTSGR